MDEKLLNAKRFAVQAYIRRGPRAAIRAMAVSIRPEHNVTGIGIGKKIVNGKQTDQDCVRLYVEKKVGPQAIPPDMRLPASIMGVPTDVVESGRFHIGPQSAAAPAALAAPVEQTRLRPAPPGCSIGFGVVNGMIMAGTFGVLVTNGADTFILSNNHVLANVDKLPVGSPIYQPGLLDGGNPDTDQIAMLTQAIRLNPSSTNQIDCAIAQIIVPADATPVALPQVGQLGGAASVPATVGMSVEKVGRTTSYTQGTVSDISAHVQVDYDDVTMDFDNIVVVNGSNGPFSAAGDSGSLIVDQATKRGTALLFAGSSQFTLANKLELVLGALGVTIVI